MNDDDRPRSDGSDADEPAENGKVSGRSDRAMPSLAALPFPVVGIGASAGGLEALQAFLSELPADPELAVVVVTHQHAGHVSLLPDLLAGSCAVPVSVAEDGHRVEKNHVYVGPPGVDVTLVAGHLQLLEPDPHKPVHVPIDTFFRSLANDQRELAIGVVLSGTGTDGTAGMVAIRGGAGLTLVQDPGSARYDGMPRSAIDAGAADYVAAPERLPDRMLAYVRNPHAPWKAADAPLPGPLKRVVTLAHKRTGADFSGYKESTVRRRIERRMGVHGLEDPAAYLRYVERHPHELDQLFRELLIGVTSFFRDADAWEALEPHLRAAVAELPANRSFRAWVPGCSTGEEPYTLAMLLREAFDEANRPVEVQIFATDLDARAVDRARAGKYPESIGLDVAPGRLQRFFRRDEEGAGYAISKEIREMVVFAEQNVIVDPPFTRLDLLVCRNLLIYLEPELQERLLPLFHYAIRPGGLMFLGSSENAGRIEGQFDVVDKKWRIFRRVGGDEEIPRATARRSGAREPAGMPPLAPPRASRATGLARFAQRLLLSTFAPASVIVDGYGDIVYVHGHTGMYFEPAQGEPVHNVFAMAREGLRLELPAAMRRAARTHEPVVHSGVPVRNNGGVSKTRITVTQVEDPSVLRGYFLICLEPEPEAQAERPEEPGAQPAGEDEASEPSVGRIAELEAELMHVHERHQSTVEELETSNEELKSTNEELQSTNEELQSSNEELETSREEMQSLNEELQTVNSELQGKIDELARIKDNMQNLMNSTDIATLFLDRDLCIQSFTEPARRIINVIDRDVGRHVGDLAHHLEYDGLLEDASEVLRTLEARKAEVRTTGGEWRLMRMLPYRTSENVIDGVVVTFVDIDDVKQAQLEGGEERLLAETLMEVPELGLAVLDADLTVMRANRAFAAASDREIAEVEGGRLFELAGGRWDTPELRSLVDGPPPPGGGARYRGR